MSTTGHGLNVIQLHYLNPPIHLCMNIFCLQQEKGESISKLNEEIVQEVSESMPGLEVAEKAIKALDKKDMADVRVMNKPPDLVLLVMEPICILLNVK